MTTKQDVAAASIDADLKPLFDGIIERVEALEAVEPSTASPAALDFMIALMQADRASDDKDALYSAMTAALAQYSGA